MINSDFGDYMTFSAITSSQKLSIHKVLAVAENYKRKFGYYSEAVLSDIIYQTRKNRSWCKEKGIRLSGPPLDRRMATMTDARVKKQLKTENHYPLCQRIHSFTTIWSLHPRGVLIRVTNTPKG